MNLLMKDKFILLTRQDAHINDILHDWKCDISYLLASCFSLNGRSQAELIKLNKGDNK